MRTITLILASVVFLSLTVGEVTAADGDWEHERTINSTDGPIDIKYGDTPPGANGYWSGLKVVLNESFVSTINGNPEHKGWVADLPHPPDYGMVMVVD